MTAKLDSTIPSGCKHTEIGVIPEDWKDEIIGDVCKLINGRGFKPFEWTKDGLPIIRIQNLNGSIEFNYYKGSFDKKIAIETGQLLFAWSGSRGTSFGPYIWKGSLGLLNYHTWKININNDVVDSEYYFHALKRLTKFIEDNAHGASALVHVQKWEMEKYKFPLPPTLEEQIAISEALSDTDELIGSMEKLIEKKRRIKQGAMQELLTGKRRLPGFGAKSGKQAFKQTEIGVIPEDWEVKRLGEMFAIKDGTHQTPKYVNVGIPFYSVESVTNNDFIKTKHISENEHKQLTSSFRIETGDILMTRIGSIGDCKYIDWEVNASFYVSLALLKPKGTSNARYIAQYSNTNEFRTEIEINSLLTAIPKKINLGSISNVRCALPSTLEEQIAIATVLSDMDSDIAELEAKLDKYRKIKQGMMQELLTGRIRLV